MKKLAILSTHPIQYNAPFFRMLSRAGEDLQVKVFYTLGMEASGFKDSGFGKSIAWDIPLLEGYNYAFVENTAKNPTTSRFNGVINPGLIQELEQFAPSHILVYGWSFNSHLKVLRHFHKKATILFRGDSTLLAEQLGLKKALRRLWLTWVYSFIDVAFYVGTNNKQYYLKHGVPEHKLIFAPHAIDNDRFSDDTHAAKAEAMRIELGIELAMKVFLFTGKFNQVKNPLLLIKAFNQISGPDTILLMVGNGALEDDLMQLAKGNPNIIFLEFQNQSMMPAVYRLGDILVLPSVSETWGLSMNEAMACGLAVIASDKVGGAPDLIESGSNGYIFKSGSLEDLEGVLNIFAKMSKEMIRDMGRFSAGKIEGWSYRHTCDAIIDYINNN